jgi:hypothetical protein
MTYTLFRPEALARYSARSVSACMAKCIVDGLEVIDVEEEQGQRHVFPI